MLIFVGAFFLAGCHPRPAPGRFISLITPPDEPVVQLWCAKVPQAPDLAYHCWFLSFTPGDDRWRRWEVWHEFGVSAAGDGPVLTDRLPAAEGMGRQPGWPIAQWRGAEAEAIQAVLREPGAYPHQRRYRFWPGPNSNTYIRWVLRRAGAAGELPPQAIGKDYLGPIAGVDVTTTRAGVQAETPLLGAAVGWVEGVEVHILCLTFGLDLWPPAVKTPLGRLGWPP